MAKRPAFLLRSGFVEGVGGVGGGSGEGVRNDHSTESVDASMGESCSMVLDIYDSNSGT